MSAPTLRRADGVVLFALAAAVSGCAQDALETQLRQAAEAGNAEAQFDLGFMYTHSLWDVLNAAEANAVRWFAEFAEISIDAQALETLRQAAEAGNVDAQFNLGLMYDGGEGVPEDEAEAVRWYRMRAEQGDASAQYILGFRYADGEGVLKDAVLAHMWLNIAGANGDKFARAGRDRLEQDMTLAQIDRATELARTCMASDYEDCER